MLTSTHGPDNTTIELTRVDKPTIASLFSDAAKVLRAEFEYVRTTNPHSGEKGAEAEEIVKKFLNNHLPQRFRAASGVVIDERNQLSKQTDVIVYDALASAVYRAADRMQIVPANVTAAAIEVKSSLTKDELRDAYEKIASVKSLEKTAIGAMDRPTTRTGLDTIGTMGVVFGFDSDTSLAALAKNARELNTEFESFLWPDMIVVLDKGIVTYAVQWPGIENSLAGALSPQPPKGHDLVSPPPWFVSLVEYREESRALNRFFLTLLSHLSFYPNRYGIPKFEVGLGSADAPAMVVAGYQFNLSRELRPTQEEYNGKPGPLPLQMNLRNKTGALIGVLQHIPWQDGFVIRKYGGIPLEIVLPLVIKDKRVQVLHEPAQPGMQITSITQVTEADFRKWPKKLQGGKIKAQIVEPDSPEYGRIS